MTDTASRVVFAQAIEATLKAVGDQLTPELKAEFRSFGLDVDAPLQAAYPDEVRRKLLAAVARHLFPGLPPADAHWELGRRFWVGWSSTLVGRATAQILKVIGTTRALKRMTRNFRTGDNHTEVDVVEDGPGDVRLIFNDVIGMPHYFAGIISAGAQAIGAKDVVVTVEEGTPPGGVIRVRWTP